jgi:hypothetical protein
LKAPLRGDAPARIQPKLKVNAPGDVYEREADRVAEQVMRMPEPRAHSEAAVDTMASPAQVQTSTVPAGDRGGSAAPPIVHDVLNSPGQSLDAATRAFMEPRFGRDFGDVRVHTDAQAAESAAAIDAAAYTVKADVVFGTGQYLPQTTRGDATLAHELTHVVQQSHAGVVLRQGMEPHPGPLQYRTETPSTITFATPANLERMNVASGVAAFVAGLLGAIVNSKNYAEEMKRLQPTIDKAMPNKGGVLIEVIYWEDPFITDFSARLFKNAYIIGAGETPGAAYLHKRPEQLFETPTEGWQRVEIPVWIPSPEEGK